MPRTTVSSVNLALLPREMLSVKERKAMPSELRKLHIDMATSIQAPIDMDDHVSTRRRRNEMTNRINETPSTERIPSTDMSSGRKKRTRQLTSTGAAAAADESSPEAAAAAEEIVTAAADSTPTTVEMTTPVVRSSKKRKGIPRDLKNLQIDMISSTTHDQDETPRRKVTRSSSRVIESGSASFPAADDSDAAYESSDDEEPPAHRTRLATGSISPAVNMRKSIPRELRNLEIDMVPSHYMPSDNDDDVIDNNYFDDVTDVSDSDESTTTTIANQSYGSNGIDDSEVIVIEDELPRKEVRKPPSEWLRFLRWKDYEWDRIRVRQNEGEKTSLENMREQISKEKEFFGDYYEKYKEEVEELLVKKAEKEGIEHNPSISRKLFWFYEIQQKNRAGPTHCSLDCSNIRLSKKKGHKKMTESHVESILRFIAIGALCEKCVNPFGLSQENLDQVAPICTCPKPSPPVFPLDFNIAENVHEEHIKKEVQTMYWNMMCKTEEAKAKEGMKKYLISEMGEEAFKKEYPKYNIGLEKRTDVFGRGVHRRQQELHTLRRTHNQPPTFIFAWTGKEHGTPFLPAQWILDGTMELSEGAEKRLRGKNLGLKKVLCQCVDNCATGKKCCLSKIKVNWHVNNNGVLTMKNGLGPCGTEGDSIRQPHETDWVQASVCSDECECDINCPLRFAHRGTQKMKILFMTHFKGWSLRTVEPTVRGEYILSFSGVVSTQEEMEANNENLDMIYDIVRKAGMREGDELSIATDARSNEFRCINHSCAPNSLILITYSKKFGEFVHGVSLFSRRPLKSFEEITFDYYQPGQRFRFDCMCGSYACRGIKGDV